MDDFISKVFPCLQDNYNYTSAKPNEQKAIEWYRENLEINLDSNEAACFTKIFSFRKESCLADVEEKIRVKIGEILGTDNSDAIDFCLNSLLSKLNIWATSRREKQEITRENVYGALCYTRSNIPTVFRQSHTYFFFHISKTQLFFLKEKILVKHAPESKFISKFSLYIR